MRSLGVARPIISAFRADDRGSNPLASIPTFCHPVVGFSSPVADPVCLLREPANAFLYSRCQYATVRTRPILVAAAVVAAVATAGSLYFSEVLGLVPCELCWYQRVLMYPLVVVLGVAAFEERSRVYLTGLPLALGGAAVAAYHSYIQLTPAATCAVDGDCTAILWQGGFGLLTIPRLALVAFLLIAAGLAALAVVDRRP